MGLIDRDDGWRMPDWLWQEIEPLLPSHWAPLGDASLTVKVGRNGEHWSAETVNTGTVA
jgi:hypothetical protein